MGELLRDIKTDSMITGLITYKELSRIGLPVKRLVSTGTESRSGESYLHLGSVNQLEDYVGVIYDNPFMEDPVDLLGAIDDDPGKALLGDLMRRAMLPDHLVREFSIYRLDALREGFEHGDKFLEGPLVIATRPGRPVRIVRNAEGVWVPTHLALGQDWRLI